MAHMSLQQAHRSEALMGLALGAAAVIETTADGVLVLLGLVTLGAALGAWIVVYDHAICRVETLRPGLLLPWILRGAVVMPGLAALHLVYGMVVWVTLILALWMWAVRASLQSS
jgi:hypothetical protein